MHTLKVKIYWVDSKGTKHISVITESDILDMFENKLQKDKKNWVSMKITGVENDYKN
jgi:hypothetical protein